MSRISGEDFSVSSFANDDEELETKQEAEVESIYVSPQISVASSQRSLRYSSFGSSSRPSYPSKIPHSSHLSSSGIPLPKKKSPITKFQQLSQQLDLDATASGDTPSLFYESDVSIIIWWLLIIFWLINVIFTFSPFWQSSKNTCKDYQEQLFQFHTTYVHIQNQNQLFIYLFLSNIDSK